MLLSLIVILHITVQVLRDGAYNFPSSSEKTIILTNCKTRAKAAHFPQLSQLRPLRQVRPRTRAYLALVAQKVDSAVHQINYYPLVRDR